MASNVDFVRYVSDQCSGAGEITFKKMFGEYGLYCDGMFFGVICDDRLFVKPIGRGEALVPDAPLLPAYDGARPSIYFENVNDSDALSVLVKTTCEVLMQSKKRNGR